MHAHASHFNVLFSVRLLRSGFHAYIDQEGVLYIMFPRLTTQEPSPTANTASRSPGGIPLKIEGVSKTFAGRVNTVEALRPIDLEVAGASSSVSWDPAGAANQRYSAAEQDLSLIHI